MWAPLAESAKETVYVSGIKVDKTFKPNGLALLYEDHGILNVWVEIDGMRTDWILLGQPNANKKRHLGMAECKPVKPVKPVQQDNV